MTSIAEITEYLNEFAPLALAEEWDNVGLLLGDEAGGVTRLMTCLTITSAVVEEAIDEHVELIVAHHPLPFRPLKQITPSTTPGALVWRLARAGVAVYSPHTAFDSTAAGINARFAQGLSLRDIQPLRPWKDTIDRPSNAPGNISAEANSAVGAGRFGTLPAPVPLGELCDALKQLLNIEHLKAVGDFEASVQRVAIACGSAGEFLADAKRHGCEVLITGETSFHTCLEAKAQGVALLLTGHYASERFAVEALAESLSQQFPQLSCWASRREKDPVAWC